MRCELVRAGPLGNEVGAHRVRAHLRQVFVTLDMPVLNQPQVLITNAADKFDAGGNLTDEPTRALIGQLLQNLVTLARKLGVPRGPGDGYG